MFKSVQTKAEIKKVMEGTNRLRAEQLLWTEWKYRSGAACRGRVGTGGVWAGGSQGAESTEELSTTSNFLTSPGSHLSRKGLRKI